MILNTVLDILPYYGLFCGSVGITSWFTVYKPILKKLKETNEGVWEQHNSLFTVVITMAISFVLAPIFIFVVLKGPNEDFTNTYIETLIGDDED